MGSCIDKPALVLLTGWGVSRHVWTALGETGLAAFDVMALDLRDFFPVAWREEGDDSRLSRLIDNLPKTAHLVGWSLGGMLAVLLASRYPHRIRSLTLVATNAVFQRGGDWKAGMAPVVFAQFRRAFIATPERAWRRFIGLHFQGMENARALTRRMIQLSQAEDIDYGTLRAGLEWLAQADVRDAVASLDVPTIAIQGGLDVITPVAAVHALGALNPHIERMVIDDSGHAPFVDHPREVMSWLRQLASEGDAPIGPHNQSPVRM